MDRQIEQPILNNWRQIGEHIYGHPQGHPLYEEATTLGIRPVTPLEQPEPGVVVETKVAVWRLGQAAVTGPSAVNHLLQIPYV